MYIFGLRGQDTTTEVREPGGPAPGDFLPGSAGEKMKGEGRCTVMEAARRLPYRLLVQVLVMQL